MEIENHILKYGINNWKWDILIRESDILLEVMTLKRGGKMKDMELNELLENKNYLKLMSKQYPSVAAVSKEIINLKAILNLPKGTEHFLTDIHGEYESFRHVLRNASGVLKLKIDDIFPDMYEEEKKALATLLYYPEERLDLERKKRGRDSMHEWYFINLDRVIKICRVVSSKYTRSKVRKSLPDEFAYIIEELLHEDPMRLNKRNYYNEIIATIIETERADAFIIAICKLIHRLAIDRLHIVGDIYDRGPGAHIIMDELMIHHAVDVQWGNHDVLWMGAANGSLACIANVIRICTRYGNLETLEDGYGINLLPLATFAMEAYREDPCERFMPKVSEDTRYNQKDIRLLAQMHKAISIIQFKVEGAAILKNPEYKMESRLLLDKIDKERGVVKISGKEYDMNDTNFPTLDYENPYKLTDEEKTLVNKLRISFTNSEKFQKHVKFLFSKGAFYLKFNKNLMYHACIPMNEDGSFRRIKLGDREYFGKELLDVMDNMAREEYFLDEDERKLKFGSDFMWYLWCGKDSPLFGKDQMTTFERYFVDDKSTHKENKDPYFKFREREETCNRILEGFGLNPKCSHIVSGHVPVKVKNGESPIKGNGKLLVIDGGFSKAYQKETGIAGYTLIYNSYGLRLASHRPFISTQFAIENQQDIVSTLVVLEKVDRKYVADTDTGAEIKEQIKYLQMLLQAYRKGVIKEQA